MTLKGALFSGSPRVRLVGTLLIIGLLLISATPPRRPLPAAFHQRSGLVVNGFLEAAELLGARVAYWNHNVLGDTYVLTDGRLLHALPAGTIRENGVERRRIWVVAERDAPDGVSLIPKTPNQSSFSYLQRTKTQARDLQSYDSVAMPKAWPGIDLELRNTPAGIERTYTVAPEASAEQIRVVLDGASHLRPSADGALQLTTGVGRIQYLPPIAFQLDGAGKKTLVPVSYRVFPDQTSFGFTLGKYDRSRALVIDPVLQGAYFGDPGSQSIYAMTFDPNTGDVVTTGTWEFGGVPPSSTGASKFKRKLKRYLLPDLIAS